MGRTSAAVFRALPGLGRRATCAIVHAVGNSTSHAAQTNTLMDFHLWNPSCKPVLIQPIPCTLYQGSFLKECWQRGILCSIENPGRLFMWQTSHWLLRTRQLKPLHTLFHHCMFGGSRAKLTRLIHCVPAFQQLGMFVAARVKATFMNRGANSLRGSGQRARKQPIRLTCAERGPLPSRAAFVHGGHTCAPITRRIQSSTASSGADCLVLQWSVYFDDYIGVETEVLSKIYDLCVEGLFAILGWETAEDKDTSFGSVAKVLGLRIDFRGSKVRQSLFHEH